MPWYILTQTHIHMILPSHPDVTCHACIVKPGQSPYRCPPARLSQMEQFHPPLQPRPGQAPTPLQRWQPLPATGGPGSLSVQHAVSRGIRGGRDAAEPSENCCSLVCTSYTSLFILVSSTIRCKQVQFKLSLILGV